MCFQTDIWGLGSFVVRKLGQGWAGHHPAFLQDRVSRLWHYCHCCQDNSLLWRAVLCIVPLVFTCPPNMSPNTVKCPREWGGANHPWLRTTALQLEELWYRGLGFKLETTDWNLKCTGNALFHKPVTVRSPTQLTRCLPVVSLWRKEEI